MASNLTEDCKCPICLEILRKPIRNLPCGHLFCGECLVDLVAQLDTVVSCPTCRRECPIGLNGVEGFPRIREMEHLIEHVIEGQSRVSTSRQSDEIGTSLNEQTMSLQSVASTCITNKDFKKAITVLQMIVAKSEGYYKLKTMIALSECHLKINQKQKAQKVCQDLSDIVHSHDFPADETFPFDNFYAQLRQLAQAFISINYATSILLSLCSYELSKIFYSGKDKIERLASVIFDILPATSDTVLGNTGKITRLYEIKVKRLKYPLACTKKILEEMQETACDDLKFKCLQIALCLQRMGFCYYFINSHQQAIEINKQAICLMKSVFGSDAINHKVFGICHYYLGVGYENTIQLKKANKAYLKVKHISETADDWTDDDEKSEIISYADKNLEHLSISCIIV